AGVGGTGWDDVLAVNLTAAYHLCDLAEPGLIAQRGAVVTIASNGAFVSGESDADYNAAKAGLVMLTRSLAVRLGPHGVRANAVCAGWVRTPMGDADMSRLRSDSKRHTDWSAAMSRCGESPVRSRSPRSFVFSHPRRPPTSPVQPSWSTVGRPPWT